MLALWDNIEILKGGITQNYPVTSAVKYIRRHGNHYRSEEQVTNQQAVQSKLHHRLVSQHTSNPQPWHDCVNKSAFSILFCTPGIYLALTGLGAGGGQPSSQVIASETNAYVT